LAVYKNASNEEMVMPLERYIEHKFHDATLKMIERAREICVEYADEGYSLTLRQLYYQFVAKGWLHNNLKAYKRLGSAINDARLAGLLDWDTIEDRTRNLHSPYSYTDIEQIMYGVPDQFAVDMWENQDVRLEVWIEKDALIGVVERPCNSLHVPYFACRGYTSQSEQWRAGKRFLGHLNDGKRVVLIHLGDHDPSGIDMTRDNRVRLDMFTEYEGLEVRRIALNMDQIEEHRPPPNYAKMTDSRAKGYVADYGEHSWELDALKPQIIDGLVRSTIDEYRDDEKWEEMSAYEEDTQDKLRNFMDKVVKGWTKKNGRG
jgi:hypothetical protein